MMKNWVELQFREELTALEKWFTIFFKPCMIQKSQVYDKTKQTDPTGKL